MDLWYELYEKGRMLERYHEGGEVHIHDPDSVKRLLVESGFEIAEWYGGHEKERFTDRSKIVVIVARPFSKTT